MTGQPSEFFVSYSRADSPFVLQLAGELRSAGASVWVDQLDIVAGERWDEAVQGALQRCPGLVIVLSPESVASQNFMDEVSYALDEGKTIVPVLYRRCEIPFRLRRLQHVDFTADYGSAFGRLCTALGLTTASASAAVPEMPSPPPAPRGRDLGRPDGPRGAGSHPPAPKPAAWRLAALAVPLLLLDLVAVAETCFIPDAVVLSAIIGLALALTVKRRRPGSLAWLLIPAATVLIGLPYGHAYGTMSRSPLFGLAVGEKCQHQLAPYVILLVLLAAVVVVDHLLVRRTARRQRAS